MTPPDPDEWSIVSSYSSLSKAKEDCLVVLSCKQAYWLHRGEDAFELWVPRQNFAPIRRQLDLYAKEQKNAAIIQNEKEETRDVSIVSFILFSLFLLFVYTASSPEISNLRQLGKVDALKIIDEQQIFRCITALSLHADLGHLIGNCFGFTLFAYFLAQRIGAGCSLFLSIVFGAFANALNAWMYYPEQHLSIGFSTSVFAALGLLTANSILAPENRHKEFKKLTLIFLAALSLLSLLGTGDSNTDLTAHFMGFIVAFIASFPLFIFRKKIHLKDELDILFFVISAIILFLSWNAALQ